MLVVLTIAVGYSPDYLLKEVATGRENYYTGAVIEGEPPGRWWGAGACRRGVTLGRDTRASRPRHALLQHCYSTAAAVL